MVVDSMNSSNYNAANSALSKVSSSIDNLNKTKEYIESQIENIPSFYSVKDELGQNTESCIEDISSYISSEIISPLEATLNNRDSILAQARAKDEEEDRIRKAKMEQLQTEKLTAENNTNMKSIRLDKDSKKIV